jgi:hypothetical protein
MNQTNNYYTLKPINNNYSSWQPEAVTNIKIKSESNINSSWKYRQYLQNNAKHIMKYNTMEFIYTSGNNPYSVSNKVASENTPYLYTSTHDNRNPPIGVNNSDLKHNYIAKTQLNSRMVAPTIPIK